MHFSAISSAFLPQISTAAPSGTENFHQRHRGSRFVGLYWTQLDYIGRNWTEMETITMPVRRISALFLPNASGWALEAKVSSMAD